MGIANTIIRAGKAAQLRSLGVTPRAQQRHPIVPVNHKPAPAVKVPRKRLPMLTDAVCWSHAGRVYAFLPMKTVSELNVRGVEHWSERDGRVDTQKTVTALTLRGKLPAMPFNVLLTRLSPRLLDEGDNLPSSMKAVRDSIAALAGVDDRSDLIRWDYAQAKSRDVGVWIVIEKSEVMR